MPLRAPIGTYRGLETKTMIAQLIENCTVPIVVEAGIGRPSQAAEAMEMGADAVRDAKRSILYRSAWPLY